MYDFAYFKNKASYENRENLFNIKDEFSEDCVYFIEQDGTIYVRDHEFGANANYVGGDGITITDYDNTISVDQSWLNNYIKRNSQTYTAGFAINITDNVISVNKSALGIIDNNTNPTDSSDITSLRTYVDQLLLNVNDRFANLINDSAINWANIFQTYGKSCGLTVDEVKGIITSWVSTPEGTLMVWQQLTAAGASGAPAWLSVVAENYNNWITGSQIQQLSNGISLITGMFQVDEDGNLMLDDDGNPILDPNKWAGLILGLQDDNGESFIDLVADKVNITGEAFIDTLNTNNVSLGSGSSTFNADGSGSLANGNITWNTNGDVIINGNVSRVVRLLFWNDSYTLPDTSTLVIGHTEEIMVFDGPGFNRPITINVAGESDKILLYENTDGRYLPVGSDGMNEDATVFSFQEAGLYIATYAGVIGDNNVWRLCKI